MWNDIETTNDLLNFEVIADTAAKIVIDSNGQPVSIGVSGSWGSGKSSLVKMIGKALKKSNGDKKFVFIEFNAWLYQGYDDARMALLQIVADRLFIEAENNQSLLDKVKSFTRRINWLRMIKASSQIARGAIIGATVGGPVGAVGGVVAEVVTDSETFDPQNLMEDKTGLSIPKEISAVRDSFQKLLEDMKITLVVLVDDLDRCLPDTAISTLEAMRLLLFTPRTAFIIAADEEMIRNAVRSHFGMIEMTDELVTSYFDKLIQIPLRVPRLGTTEVKGYLIMLLADLEQRRGTISEEEMISGQQAILRSVKKSWAGGLTKKSIETAYGTAAAKLSKHIEMADQLSNIMTTSEHIAGNPRLIKRFLNNLIIRDSIAKAQGMSVSFEELVKLQLFERCASTKAFEYLEKQVWESEDGKLKVIADIENNLSKGEECEIPTAWVDSFINDWFKLNPPLGDIDLRPLLYLSRDKAVTPVGFDELSPEGREILAALCEAKQPMTILVQKITLVGEAESEKLLTRMKKRVRSMQWDLSTLKSILNIVKAFPSLSTSYVSLLDEIPAEKRPAPLIPIIRDYDWSSDLLVRWKSDDKTPEVVKRAIAANKKGGR